MLTHTKGRHPKPSVKAISRMYEGTPFRLTDIEIKNVRCFEHVKIGLRGPNGPKSWAMILGDNGVGKTTLLRCLAIGMCDESSASGLLREIYGDWNRKVGDDLLKAEIRLTFDTDQGPRRTITKIEPQGSGYSIVRQSPALFPWDGIFACGYGSARRGFGSKDVADYATIDSVYTLFNYDEPLQNPELVLRRLGDALSEKSVLAKKGRAYVNKEMRRLLDSLCSILMLPEGSIRLDSQGLMLAGPWGIFQPIGGLGDGYQATFSLLTDLIGWALLYDPERALADVTGIVLIDEIEQHLHPRWQREIVRLLHDHFPNVQFIATTHTPMCAVGTTSLRNDECELIKLQRDEGAVVARENLLPPRHQGADQVLTSLLFDLPSTRDDATLEKTARLNQLNRLKSERSLRPDEKEELGRIRVELARTLFDISPFENSVRRAVQKELEKRSPKTDTEAVGYEVIRVLREIAADA